MSALDAAAQSVQELVWLDHIHASPPEPSNLELESAPQAMPSGWAAILYLFDLR